MKSLIGYAKQKNVKSVSKGASVKSIIKYVKKKLIFGSAIIIKKSIVWFVILLLYIENFALVLNSEMIIKWHWLSVESVFCFIYTVNFNIIALYINWIALLKISISKSIFTFLILF